MSAFCLSVRDPDLGGGMNQSDGSMEMAGKNQRIFSLTSTLPACCILSEIISSISCQKRVDMGNVRVSDVKICVCISFQLINKDQYT